MVAAATTDVAQLGVLTATGADAGTLDVSQLGVFAAVNTLADDAYVSQLSAVAAVKATDEIQVSQLGALVAVLRRPNNPRLRVWTFTLDGHDMYVLRLGETETLVYDTHSEQWYVWSSGETTQRVWRPSDGTNWDSANGAAAVYGTSIVVGDDTNGALYFLSTNDDQDDDFEDGELDPHSFRRRVYTQAAARGYDSFPCDSVELLGSIGDLTVDTLTDVQLEYSDDSGNTFVDAGTISTVDGTYNTRLNWQSLGSFSAPGRLFRFTDYGALRRVDSVTLNYNKG